MQGRFGDSRHGSFGGFRQPREPRERHKAICSECHQQCEVPFKPIKDKPVYCRDCYKNKAQKHH